jgi:hypothetical protein
MYHPKGLPVAAIQNMLQTSLLNPKKDKPFGNLCSRHGKKINVTNMVISNHQPNNLGHFLSPRKLKSDRKSVASYVSALSQMSPPQTQAWYPSSALLLATLSPTTLATSEKTVLFNPYQKKRQHRDSHQPKDNLPLGNNPDHTSHSNKPNTSVNLQNQTLPTLQITIRTNENLQTQ